MTRNPAPPLDPITWAVVQDTIHKGLRGGQDVAEALNKAGLLVTPARAHQMEIAGLRALLDSLYGWSTVEMLRKRNRSVSSATPADMYEAVLAYVGEFIKHVEGKGL